MTKWMTASLFAALAFIGPAFTQAPAEALPSVEVEGGPDESTGRFWTSVDYLLGWVHSPSLPALVTTSPPGTGQLDAGVLGRGSTTTLVGGGENNGARSGGRFEMGYRPALEGHLGIEGGVMLLESKATLFGAISDGTGILAQPFQNALTGAQQSKLIAFPGTSVGAVEARIGSGNFFEGHIDVTENFWDCDGVQLYSLLGYRFYRYDEGVRLRQTVLPTDPHFVPGTQVLAEDDFLGQNVFNGFDMGVRGEFSRNNLALGLLARVAVGDIHRNVIIRGTQLVSVPGAAPVARAGNVYGLSSNIGDFNTHGWGALPELGATLTWTVRSGVRLRCGYSWLLLNNVASAATQIDTTINPNLFPPGANGGAGPARPAPLLSKDNISITAVNLGLELAF